MDKKNQNKASERLNYLKSKESLTQEEMKEFEELSPPGSFKAIGSWEKIGIYDGKAFESASNFKFVGKRIPISIDSGFYLEAISLRLMYLDFCLRLYLSNKGEKFKEKHPYELQFGALIKRCRKFGFDDNLLKRIEDFNKDRILAIHNFIYEGVAYDNFKDFLIKTDNLFTDILRYL